MSCGSRMDAVKDTIPKFFILFYAHILIFFEGSQWQETDAWNKVYAATAQNVDAEQWQQQLPGTHTV